MSATCLNTWWHFSRSGGLGLQILFLRVAEAVYRLDAVGHVNGKDQHHDDNGHTEDAGPDANREKRSRLDGRTENVVLRERLYLLYSI